MGRPELVLPEYPSTPATVPLRSVSMARDSSQLLFEETGMNLIEPYTELIMLFYDNNNRRRILARW